MSYKTIEIAAPGHYLDGRPREERDPRDPRYLPPNTQVRLLEAVGLHGYHRDGDRWVEWFDTSRPTVTAPVVEAKGDRPRKVV